MKMKLEKDGEAVHPYIYSTEQFSKDVKHLGFGLMLTNVIRKMDELIN